MRFDVNVSVRPEGADELRTRTELKNINSFNFAAQGIEREIKRQVAIYESGGEVEQETLHFVPGHEHAPPLRSKEEAQDYRYFPEPDLVPIEPPAAMVERARAEIGELPSARIRRLETELDFGLAEELVTSGRDDLYSRTPGERRAVANVLMNELTAAAVDPAAIDGEELGKLIEARDRIPREAFTKALAGSGDPGFKRRRLPGRDADRRRLGARPVDRADSRGERGAGGRLPWRQGGAARILRRPGDEGDRRQGRPQGRERAAAREAKA